MPDDLLSRALAKLLRYATEEEKGKLGFEDGWFDLDLALKKAEANARKMAKNAGKDRREHRELPEVQASFEQILQEPGQKRFEVRRGPSGDPTKRWVRALDGVELQDHIVTDN